MGFVELVVALAKWLSRYFDRHHRGESEKDH
jgi:hypothetical protein